MGREDTHLFFERPTWNSAPIESRGAADPLLLACTCLRHTYRDARRAHSVYTAVARDLPTGALTSRSRAPWRHAHLANGGAMEPNRRERRNGLQDRRQPPPGSRAGFGCFEQLGHRKPIWASKAAMNARAQRRNGHAACAKCFMYLLGAVPPVHFHVPRRHRKSLARSAPMRQCRSRWCLPVPKQPKKPR